MSDKLVTVSVVVCSLAATAWAALHGYLYGLSVPGLVILPILYPVTCLPLLGAKMVFQLSVWPLPALILMHLLGVTLLPALLMVELGGFATSGGVICWSSAGPFTALLLHLRPVFKYGFLTLYFAAVSFAFAWTVQRPGGFLLEDFEVAEWQVQLYACMTVFGMTLFAYLLLWVLQREVSVQAALHKSMIHSFMPSAVGKACLELLIKESQRNEVRNSLLKTNRVSSLNSNSSLQTPSPGQSEFAHNNNSSLSGGGLKARRSSNMKASLTRTHTSVTVIRCNLLGFMTMHQNLPAPAMLQFLDRVICSIDSHADAFGLSKVCTSDGGYIAVAGLVAEFGVPQDRLHHAVRAVMFSLSVLNASKNWNWPDGSPMQLQFGLASGSLSSGLMGDVQSQYGVIGIVPCVAACMMRACLPGCIHLTTECSSLVQSSLASGPVATALGRKGSPLLQMERKTGVKLESMVQEQATVLIRPEDNAGIVEALPDVQQCLESSKLMYTASMKRRSRFEVASTSTQVTSSHHDQLTWLLET
jgi:class 3 adenylate cyclase